MTHLLLVLQIYVSNLSFERTGLPVFLSISYYADILDGVKPVHISAQTV